MDAEYDELWKRLGRLFRDAGIKDCTIIPFCPLSAFFDFKAFDAGAFTELEKDAVRYAHLAFACVVTGVPAEPTLLAAIVQSSGSKYLTGTLRALRTKLQIEPIIWGESESAHKLTESVQARIDQGIEPINLAKCPTNSWGEKKAAKLIQKALWLNPTMAGNLWKEALAEAPEASKADVALMREELRAMTTRARKEHWFWREAPLRLFIECTPADLSGDEARLRDLWWMTSADLLITTRAPDYKPVLAIEYDGGDHDSDKQRATDAKRDEIFRRAGLPLMRVRYNDLNGRDPLVGPRLEAAVRLVVERQALEERDEVKRLNSQITRLLALAISRAKARGELEPRTFRAETYLTADEEDERFRLGLELDQVLDEDEHWSALQSEREAGLYYGIGVTLDSIACGKFGHFARVTCSELDGTPLGKVTGDCIRFTGPENATLRYAERQIAIGAAFELAERIYGKN